MTIQRITAGTFTRKNIRLLDTPNYITHNDTFTGPIVCCVCFRIRLSQIGLRPSLRPRRIQGCVSLVTASVDTN